MRAAEFGVELESALTSMKGVQARKRAMVESLRQLHLDRYRSSGAELIMGEACFVGEKTVDVELADGGQRRISGRGCSWTWAPTSSCWTSTACRSI